MFADMNQNLDPLYYGVMNNRENWNQLASDHERKMENMATKDHG